MYSKLDRGSNLLTFRRRGFGGSLPGGSGGVAVPGQHDTARLRAVGQDVGLLRQLVFTLDTSATSLAGVDVSIYKPTAELIADTSAVALGGVDIDMTTSRGLAPDVSAVALAGVDITMSLNRRLILDAAALAATGIDIILEEPQDVFVFAGQSNMRAIGGNSGNVPVELQTPDADVMIWNLVSEAWEVYEASVNSDTAGGGVETDLYGPEGEFIRLWRAANPTKTAYIVKLAINSSGLNDRWRPAAADLFDDMTAAIAAATASLANPKVRAILFEQGGTDAEDSGDAAAYETNLEALIAGARSSWGDNNSRFIYGRARADFGDFASVVRAAQDAVAAGDASVDIYYNDARVMIDEAHWNAASVKQMGQDMFDCFNNVYDATPDAFADGDWSLTPGNLQISVGISGLPANNGALITDIEYRVDGGSWVSSGGISGFVISSLTNGIEYDVEIRAVNSAGVSPASTLKSATPASASTPVDISFTDSDINSAPSNPNTFAAMAIGAADADREVFVAVMTGVDVANTTFPTVTVGGISATRIAEQISETSAAVHALCAFYRAVVPTGTTADVVISGVQHYVTAFVWRVMNAGVLHAVVETNGNPTGGVPVSGDVNTVDDGGVLAMFTSFAHGTLGHTWAGLTEQAEHNFAAFVEHSVAHAEVSSGETPRTISVTPGAVSGNAASDGYGLVIVSLEPA